MKFAIVLSAFVTASLLSVPAQAGDLPRFLRGGEFIHGGNAQFQKTAVDTVVLMGPTASGAPYIGDFEAGWNGWTSIDLTGPTVSHWQVSNYNQSLFGNLAAWCGDISFAACSDSLDMVGGYGNNWNDLLVYRVAVANPAVSASVSLTAFIQFDSEPGYDFTDLSLKTEGNLGYTAVQSWTGKGVENVVANFVFEPSELAGGTDVYILWRFRSDSAWSDENCLWWTSGACQIDDITVTVSQTGESDIVSFSDFQDGTFGDWDIEYPLGVGDFAGLWKHLEDVDPCALNYSQQVAFIDDGVVVPGTGGSLCLNWCYGPGGYIVNTTGGLSGPADHLYVVVASPVMPWPSEAYDGVLFSYDIYNHEELDADSPGMFWEWQVRSADTDGSAGPVEIIEEQPWVDRIFRNFPGPRYERHVNDVTSLMHPGRDEIQVRLGVHELGWAFGFTGDDGFPAPYFDNVSVKIYPYHGPSMTTRELELAQDTFAEIDALPTAGKAITDASALATMHVRFDMAKNISQPAHMRNDPGDSVTVDIVPVRSGSVVTTPEMHYTMQANPVFAAARMAGFSTSGMVLGSKAQVNGSPSLTKWAFDLPDTGFLFPGDILHYYFRAGDDAGGGDVLYSTLPDDITGFGNFSLPLMYISTFTMHALPTIGVTAIADVYTQPAILFWNDQANRGSEDEWYSALGQLSYQATFDFDIYYTNSPSSGVGNGIGGRTSGLALYDYETILYTAGALSSNTISNGDFQYDAGDDITALNNWLSAGNKNMYLTGDSIASDLVNNAGAAGQSFLEDVMGLDLFTNDVRSLIDNQSAPLVLAVAGNSVVATVDSWIAYGGCVAINTFDAVTVRPGAERLAEFANANGAAGAYTFSALTRNDHNTSNRIISQPYDFQFTYIDPNDPGSNFHPGRVALLDDILSSFGMTGNGSPSAVLPQARFATSNYPNPFNPSTKISYTIKGPGRLSLKVYNVRGELVKTLVDGQVTEDSFVMWDGTNNQGSAVSSGVYFYEARMGNDVEVNKMALVK